MIPSEWVIPGGATGLLALVFLMVVRGYLVPPRLVHREEYDRAVGEARAERDEWKELALKTIDQNQRLLRGARAIDEVLEAFPAKGGDG
jgi:hypothetical protein